MLDKYVTDKTPAIHQWLLKHPRFQPHFTPTSSSWLNLVERWFAELTSRKLRRSAHQQRHKNRGRHPQMDQRVEQEPQAVRLDEDRDDILEICATANELSTQNTRW